jgi:hypothetical protein
LAFLSDAPLPDWLLLFCCGVGVHDVVALMATTGRTHARQGPVGGAQQGMECAGVPVRVRREPLGRLFLLVAASISAGDLSWRSQPRHDMRTFQRSPTN